MKNGVEMWHAHCRRPPLALGGPVRAGHSGRVALKRSEYVKAFLAIDPSRRGDVYGLTKRFGMLEARQALPRVRAAARDRAVEQERALTQPAAAGEIGPADSPSAAAAAADEHDRDLKWQQSVQREVERATTAEAIRSEEAANELRHGHAVFTAFIEQWDARERRGEAVDDLVRIFSRHLLGIRPVVMLDASGRMLRSRQADPTMQVHGVDVLARAWGELWAENSMDPETSALASAPTVDAAQRASLKLRDADREALRGRMQADRRKGMTISEIAKKYDMPRSTVWDWLRSPRDRA
jgi:hypothetical protein